MSQPTRWAIGTVAVVLGLAGCGSDARVETTGSPATTIESTPGPGLVSEPTPLLSQLLAAPDSLSNEDLLTIAREAELTESWGCGLGFTIASADQHVALFFYPVSEDASASPVSFPDSTWSGKLIVGNDLLANNCDDIIEENEPVAVSAAEWEVSAGTLTFDVPADALANPESVTAELAGVIVDTPAGPLELGDLTIVNDAFGFFAG